MPQAVNSDILLNANDTFLIYTSKDIKMIEEQLNTDLRFCLNLDNKVHVGINEFIKINWLATGYQGKSCTMCMCKHL